MSLRYRGVILLALELVESPFGRSHFKMRYDSISSMKVSECVQLVCVCDSVLMQVVVC